MNKYRDYLTPERIRKAVRWALLAAGAVLLLLALYLFGRHIANEMMVGKIREENFEKAPEPFGVRGPQSYIPYYNRGIIAYRQGKYDEAVSYFEKALSCDPPEGEECPVRVNLARSMVEQIDLNDLDTPEKKKRAVRILKDARRVLCEEGCADEDGTDGHDEAAETLKKEIDEILSQLEDETESESESESETETETEKQSEKNNKNKNNDSSRNKEREKSLQEKLKESREKANQERKEAAEEQERRQAQQEAQGGGNSENGDPNGGGEEGGEGEGSGGRAKYW